MSLSDGLLQEAIAGLDGGLIGPRCVVTGGAGFYGRALVAALRHLGVQVVVFDRVAVGGARDEGITQVVGDLRDAGALARAFEGAATVFHTAALINLQSVYRPETRREVFEVNVEGARRVVEASRACGVRRLVTTSTVNVCFDPDNPAAREREGADERTPYASAFVDLYTETKVAAEKIILGADAALGGASSALRPVALRPGGLWGPGEGGVMLKTFVGELAAGRFKVLVGDGRARADNTHIYNLAQATIRAAIMLATRPEVGSGGAYFVTDGEPINAVEWFRPVVEALGCGFPSRRVPAGLVERAALAMEWAHRLGGPPALVTRSAILKITRDHTFSVERARRELGYTPTVQRRNGLPLCMEALRSLHAKRRR